MLKETESSNTEELVENFESIGTIKRDWIFVDISKLEVTKFEFYKRKSSGKMFKASNFEVNQYYPLAKEIFTKMGKLGKIRKLSL